MFQFKTLVNIFFFCCLLPFCSPIPLGYDVQPPAFIFALILIAIRYLKNKTIPIYDLFILVPPILALLYFNPFLLSEYFPSMGKYLAPVAAGTTYLAAKQNYKLFSQKTLYLAISAYFFVSILFLISPSTAYNLQLFVVRTINQDFGEI